MASKVRLKQDLPWKSKQNSPETNWELEFKNEGKMDYWGPVTWTLQDVGSIDIFIFVVNFLGFDAVSQREEGEKKRKDT